MFVFIFMTLHICFFTSFFLFYFFQSCPMCSETFTDAAALVTHFETSHSSDGRGSGVRNRGGTGAGGGAGGKASGDCSLS